jgi:hypothetical protein
MKPIPWFNSPRPEQIPEDVITVDFIHQAVRRIMEGEADGDPAAPTVRIVNLSIGDPCRQFSHTMSPLARLLDWLSVKYNILFIISAGNHPRDIDTGVTSADFEGLSQTEIEELVVSKLYEDTRHRRILSPAESINGITVGSSHHDISTPINTDWFINVFAGSIPSPVSPFGSGYRRSVKPDLIYPGGRVLYEKPVTRTDNVMLPFRQRKIAPGNMVAAPGGDAGDLGKTVYGCGTSNSAARISRAASACYESLQEICEGQMADEDFERYGVPLLKSALVHGSSWGEDGDRLRDILNGAGDNRVIKNLITRWMGYGHPDINKVLGCTPQRVSLLGFGQLSDGEAHVFSLPLPPSLGASLEKRKLTATLAWLSPVAPATQRYREAQLWYEVENGLLETSRTSVDWMAVRRGTVQHEVFEGEKAAPINDGDTMAIKVNCKKDARRITSPIPYGLVVSLEVAEGVDIPVYEEIRARVAPVIEIRPAGSH